MRGGQIAVIFQDPMTSLNPVMTIGNQIAEAVRVNLGQNAAPRKRAVEVCCSRPRRHPRAAERLDDYPHQFSGGMRQRVMIRPRSPANPGCSSRMSRRPHSM